MKSISRRAFGRGAIGGTVVAAVSTTGCGEVQAPIASLSSLKVGESVPFMYPDSHPAFLVKLGAVAEGGIGPDADIVAFHTACPHMGCPLPVGNAEAITRGELGPCACHQSTFDLRAHGRQIYGRASQNLVRVLLEIQGDDIYAVGIEGLPFGEALRCPA